MSDETDKKGLFELTFETQQLISQGKDIPEGGLWTYEAMNKATGLDITERRGLLGSARRNLQSQYGMVFEPVVNTGLRRLANSDKPKLAVHAIGKTQNIMKRANKALGTIDVNALAPDARVELFTNITVMHVAEQSMQHKTIAKVRAAVEGSKSILPVGETLKLFEGR